MSEAWRVVVAASAARALHRLPAKAVPAVFEAMHALAANPQRMGKPLRFELEGCWSARRGPYRVIYRIDEERRVVTVIAVAHRATAYRPD